MPQSIADSLTKSLGILRGTALLLNIVIGAGLLTLPGLAVREAGGYAFASWLVCAAASLPLLGIFLILGRRFPEAGGISAYAKRAFGPFGQRLACLLFLGAVIFGLPAISLTGGNYITAAIGGSSHLYAGLIILCAMVPHLIPGSGAAKTMAWLASLIIFTITLFLLVGLAGNIGEPYRLPIQIPAVGAVNLLLPPFMMIFFAFTGWEVGAGIAEEFINPRRDYPIAMLLSFTVALMLYLAIAYVAQGTDLTGYYQSPFVAIVRPVLGQLGIDAICGAAALIIFANLSGAVWGVSRMVFGLGRDRVLPPILGRTQSGRPIVAVIATICVLLGVVSLDGLGFLGIARMFSLAGQNFLILYGIAALVVLKLCRPLFEKTLAVLVLAETALILSTQGISLIYPAIILTLAALLTHSQSKTSSAMRA
jgi:amino acid efflux transporter